MSQNPNQGTEYISGFFNEDEEVNESEFDELAGKQETSKLIHNQQKNPVGKEQPKKSKRPRKTIEQEIAELDARRERLMDKKRKQEAHEKIVFGAITIKALKNALMSTNRKMAAGKIIEAIIEIADKKEIEIIDKIIKKINENK